MAGYIGSKTVNLSTTGADIDGDADVSGALDVGGAFTSQGIDDNANATAITIDSSENVGIGTSSPTAIGSRTTLHVSSSDGGGIRLSDGSNNMIVDYDDNTGGRIQVNATGESLQFGTQSAERMRIDSSGNLLVGKTSQGLSNSGVELREGASSGFTRNGTVVDINRTSSDGQLMRFRKDGSTVGGIGVETGDLNIHSTTAGHIGLRFGNTRLQPTDNSGSTSDGVADCGFSNSRFDDVYATNGTIQTSDLNEKQDIAELTDAEQRVAVAAKGLMRKFRWRDAVEAKGDNARTHFGIIAQDLQAAFAAEGLDAGDYAMFISTTWWEHDVEVPAVEAVAEVLDEDNNVVTKAVEAADAYTRTDTYETQEEAPEGATERTRLGVRYSELLAFIIGAL